MSIAARFSLAYPAFTLDVNLQLPAQGITALFGPSGSGKTTLLRCIAGLEKVGNGHLIVNGECWQSGNFFLPVHRRALGYVFQEASLFPHLTVQGNLDYGAVRSRRHKTNKAPPADQRNIVELLGIGHLLQRKPERLSGGERQRVAIARALLAAPKLLLMDEPLAALDFERKREILPYLERLRDELDIPILYVSHAFDEVSRLANHLVLMSTGQAIASGSLSELTARLDLPLTQYPDAGVVIDATVGAYDPEYHLTRLDFPGGCVYAGLHEMPLGHRARISIHASDVSIALSEAVNSSIVNRLPAQIEAFAATHHPAHLLVRLNIGDAPDNPPPSTSVIARITRRSRDQLRLHQGQRVWVQIKTVALVE
nr:molybdenum ABC transporter ATP-binding protein ModC [uncultured bacterium]